MFHSLGPTTAARKMAKVSTGEREPRVGDAHDHLVDPAPEVAGEDAERGADDAGHDDGGEADDHGHARAEDEAREHVPAEVIGAEQVRVAAARLPDRRLEAVAEHAHLGIVRRDDARRRSR